MLRHRTPTVHRCDARCVPFVGSRNDCTACETGDARTYEHTCGSVALTEDFRVPAWVARAMSNTLPPKSFR